MAKAICPGCRRAMDLYRYIEAGEWVNCPRCEADLVVISVKPLILDWADDEFENPDIAHVWRGDAKRSKRDDRNQKRRSRVKSTRDSDEFD